MSGSATLTCQDSDNDGTGDFTAAPTCAGMISFYLFSQLYFGATFKLLPVGSTIRDAYRSALTFYFKKN